MHLPPFVRHFEMMYDNSKISVTPTNQIRPNLDDLCASRYSQKLGKSISADDFGVML
jgi:hypothetical protein